MPERPLILFPTHEVAARQNLGGGPTRLTRPSFERQSERLQPQFRRLHDAVDANRIILQENPTAIEPEYALVFVTAGSPDSFLRAINKLKQTHPELEWVYDLADDSVPSSDDFYETTPRGQRREGSISGKIYCIMSDHRALTDMLTLWAQYSRDRNMRFPHGLTGLRDIFDNLIDVRRWSTEERLDESGALRAWQEEIDDGNDTPIPFEIELFYRNTAAKRQQIVQEVTQAVNELGGHIINPDCCIEQIAYHAIMAELPREQIQRIIAERDAVSLVRIENIMFFRPTGQILSAHSGEIADSPVEPEFVEPIITEPIVALFDGLPQENHAFLQSILSIDDPDDIAHLYTIEQRQHGTAMASLIAHGDLLNREHPLVRKIYVRPIMRPYIGHNGSVEEVPPEINLVDLIHRAVRRLFVPEEGGVPASPQVKIINLSIGDPYRPFINSMSPLARLLDWLSLEYRVLFIVSAGNHNIGGINTPLEFDVLRHLPPNEREAHILTVINDNSRHQRLLSPAESINALTVGAIFSDTSDAIENDRQILPYQHALPSPVSALGMGYARSVKPDILYPGGRKHLFASYFGLKNQWVKSVTAPPGCLAAAPYIAGAHSKAAYTQGTSNAAALISHEGARCYEILHEVFNEQTDGTVPNDYAALLLKAMLVHGASWDDSTSAILINTLGLAGRGADDLHKWFGYGIPDINRVEECTRNRITLIGYGALPEARAHIYQLPLPFNFARRIERKLTVTLSSFVPIIASRQKYRRAHIWFTVNDDGAELISDRQDVDYHAVLRGTVQHEIFTSSTARAWDENNTLDIRVNCREDAAPFAGEIPYALFVTFEAAEGLAEDIYNEVLVRIRQRAIVAPNPI